MVAQRVALRHAEPHLRLNSYDINRRRRRIPFAQWLAINHHLQRVQPKIRLTGRIRPTSCQARGACPSFPHLRRCPLGIFATGAGKNGESRLTNLKIVTTGKRLTSTTETLMRGGVVTVEQGKSALAQLTFDGGKQEKTVDLRPRLPIVLKY